MSARSLRVNRSANNDQSTVAQSLELWLPLTANWLYNHFSNMDDVLSVVLARRLVEPDNFPWSPLITPGRAESFLFRLAKKTNRRRHPALFDRAIDAYQPLILHSHFGNMGWYDLPLAAKHGLKQITTFYGLDVNMLPTQDPAWHVRYHELFATCDLFLCEGPYMAESLMALGCPGDKVRVQRLGVDIAGIAYEPRSLEAGAPLKILVAGAFREKKGIPYALEAAGRLRREGVDVQITVIGDSRGLRREEIEKERIEAVLDRYDLRSVTRLLGFQPHAKMMAEASDHHVFLSPSVTAENGDTEGGAPMAIVEMVASGMPVVSSRHCDIPQVVLDGLTGWLADERDVDGLVSHLHWLYENPEGWRAYTDAGRAHIEAKFDVVTQAGLLSSIYHELAGVS